MPSAILCWAPPRQLRRERRPRAEAAKLEAGHVQIFSDAQRLLRALSFSGALPGKAHPARDHGQGTAAIAWHLAGSFGCDPVCKQRIWLSAISHDIGYTPQTLRVITNAGPLTALDRELVNSHVSEGVSLLNAAGVAPQVITAVQNHHERLDGSGYPADYGARK